jgi:hypothetical protein
VTVGAQTSATDVLDRAFDELGGYDARFTVWGSRVFEQGPRLRVAAPSATFLVRARRTTRPVEPPR